MIGKSIAISIKYALLPIDIAREYFQTASEVRIKNRVADIKRVAQETIDERIKEKNNLSSAGEKDNENFLDIYIDAYKRNECTKEEIVSQFLTFFFAGTDTTSHLTTMMMYMLAVNPVVQKKLYEEVSRVVPDEDEFSEKHLKEFPYLDSVINETLRMWTPASIIIPRFAIKD